MGEADKGSRQTRSFVGLEPEDPLRHEFLGTLVLDRDNERRVHYAVPRHDAGSSRFIGSVTRRVRHPRHFLNARSRCYESDDSANCIVISA